MTTVLASSTNKLPFLSNYLLVLLAILLNFSSESSIESVLFTGEFYYASWEKSIMFMRMFFVRCWFFTKRTSLSN
jgi:hypothetical protein